MANHHTTDEGLFSNRPRAYWCAVLPEWGDFASGASEDGLWQPMTDARIRAVMPLAAEGWMLSVGKERAVVDRPVFAFAGVPDGVREGGVSGRQAAKGEGSRRWLAGRRSQ